jgi:2-polyprenyl-3-methyl-5-hydroxy-6-metoxy-1,4-benzoquinol methylase
MENCTELTSCVACGSHNLKLTLDLNTQPLANSYKINKDDVQEEYPLAINRCTDCYHIQLTHSVNPHLMFDDYLYVSGTSTTMHSHCEHFAKYACDTYEMYTNIKDPKAVMDIGCNDGTQLDYFKKLGHYTYGVDPAQNLFERSSKNHTIWCDYFCEEFVDETILSPDGAPMKFDIISAQNVFAHGPEPLKFLENAKYMMHSNTLMFIQTSQAFMIRNNEFDTIYHEHISFFNIQSMNELCKRAGLYLVDVQYMPIHGTSYVFVISKNPEIRFPFLEGKIDQLIEIERNAGLYDEETYIKYAKNADDIVAKLKYETDYVQQGIIGWNVVGYGAAAKGMTLLNYSKIKLDFIVDDNPLKQGRFTPGMGIPIVSPDEIDNIGTTLFVPLAWNFFDEIRTKIKARRNKEEHQYDRFITYFPKVEMRK